MEVEVAAAWLPEVVAAVALAEVSAAEDEASGSLSWALDGSRVPHLLLMLVLHSFWALELAVLAATQSE